MPEKLIVPYQKLSKESLEALVSEFILREGTDYGSKEYSLDEKKEQIYSQLKNNAISIVFDLELESFSILSKEALAL